MGIQGGIMEGNLNYWKKGLGDGIPVALGYLAVSFTFGIAAKEAGISVFQAVIMSATNLTSAGQFAALALIRASSGYLEMAMTQLIINLRYSLMSCFLSQKISKKTRFIHRFFIASGVTDEIFGISTNVKGKLNPYYTYGVISVAVPGWVLGTFLGALSGNLLPGRVLSALGVALYGMFLAIIIPPAKDNKIISGIILVSMVLSLMFTQLPLLNKITPGFRIIILTLLIAGVAAILFPVKEG